MADETQEEIEQREKMVEVLLEQIRAGEKSIDATLKRYLAETKTGKAISETHTATTKLTKGFTSSAQALAGSTGNLNDLSSVVSGTIGAITGLLGSIPLVGPVIEKFGDVAAETMTFAMGQIQAGFSSFQELSKVGLIGANGIDGMSQAMRDSNIPLATFSKLLTTSSQDLGFLSSSALAGSKKFSKSLAIMSDDAGKPLRRLGLSVEEIGETIIDFQVMQRRQGILGQLSQDQIKKGTEEYAKELDLIAKLTGKSRADVQKEREAAMSDSRFRASTAEMDNKTRQKHMDVLALMTDPAQKRAYMDNVSGFTNTAAAIQQEINGMGSTIRKVIDDINGGGSAKDAFNAIILQSREVTKVGGMLHQMAKVMESDGNPFGSYADAADMGARELVTTADILKARNKLMDTEGTKTDKIVTSMMELQESTAALNNLFIGTDGAIEVISMFSSVMHKTIKFIEGELLDKRSFTEKTGEWFSDFTSGTTVDSVISTMSNQINSALGTNDSLGKYVGGKVHDAFGDKPKFANAPARDFEYVNGVPEFASRSQGATPSPITPQVAQVAAARSTPQVDPIALQRRILAKEKELDAGLSKFRIKAESDLSKSLNADERAGGREMMSELMQIRNELKKLNNTATKQNQGIANVDNSIKRAS